MDLSRNYFYYTPIMMVKLRVPRLIIRKTVPLYSFNAINCLLSVQGHQARAASGLFALQRYGQLYWEGHEFFN